LPVAERECSMYALFVVIIEFNCRPMNVEVGS
jgi:hypothetical protein